MGGGGGDGEAHTKEKGREKTIIGHVLSARHYS